MTVHTASKPARRSRLAGLIGVTAMAAMLVLGGASAANAVIHTPDANEAVVSGTSVNVTATAPTGAAYYAVALCNLDATAGTACSHVSGTYTAVTAGTSINETITVVDEFANWNFTTNSSGTGTTDCLGTAGTDQCGITISYYTTVTPYPMPLSSESVAIDFE